MKPNAREINYCWGIPNQQVTIERFFTEFKLRQKREPEFCEYCDFLLSLQNAIQSPMRPKAEPRKSQLKKFSDSIENMDDFTKEKIVNRVAPFFKNELQKLYPKQIHINQQPLKELIKRLLDKACDVSYEEWTKDIKRTPIATDRARIFIQRYRFMCRPNVKPSSTPDSLFANLCCVAFEAMDYPSNDPSDLIKKCLKSPLSPDCGA